MTFRSSALSPLNMHCLHRGEGACLAASPHISFTAIYAHYSPAEKAPKAFREMGIVHFSVGGKKSTSSPEHIQHTFLLRSIGQRSLVSSSLIDADDQIFDLRTDGLPKQELVDVVVGTAVGHLIWLTWI